MPGKVVTICPNVIESFQRETYLGNNQWVALFSNALHSADKAAPPDSVQTFCAPGTTLFIHRRYELE